MPTIFTHPAVALMRTWFPRLPRRVVVAAALGTIAPDLDTVGFALDIPYGSTFGHRGFTHSIFFAVVFSLIATLLVRGRKSAFAFIFLCTMSHALLDAMTNGGLGIAFFSPFSNERYFFPWTPIRVSPIGARFFSPRGLRVIASEVVWVWLPCAVLALLGKGVEAAFRPPSAGERPPQDRTAA